MRRSRVALIATVSIMVLWSVGASGQNLLVNPDFDTDLTGWDGPAVWDPADAFGSPSSGSATWINDYTAGGSTIVRQCVALDPWIEGYDFAAHVFIPSGQPGEGYTYLSIAFYSDTDCTTFLTAPGSSGFSGFDNWALMSATDWTPIGAASARIAVSNQKTASGDFQTFCDAIYFARNTEMVFGDDFESADISQWSSFDGYAWIGAYDDCSVVPCSAGIDCIAINGLSNPPFCSAQCDPGGPCPGRGGVAGFCALGNPSPTNCALLCDPTAPVCPVGMECINIGGDGLCLWPE